MSPEAEAILRADDAHFARNWLLLSNEERAKNPEGYARYNQITRYIGAGANRPKKTNGKGLYLPELAPDIDPPAWPPSVDLERLAETEPEPPKFIIRDWMPTGYASLFAGHGGAGKSALALHMAVCIAAGIPFFGLEVIGRRRVLYLSCEDREAVLHWRLARICAYLKVNLSTLRGWLEIIDLVGANTVLWAHRPAVGFSATTQFYILRDRVAEHSAQILMIDGISDTYAGNENIRAEVKQFVNAGVSLIPFNEGALILIGHVAKPDSISGGDGAGYAGSTGWHNAARARWYLYPETIPSEKHKPERTGNLLMELQKSNFGHIDQSIKFAWNEQSGLFLGEGVTNQSAFDRKHRDREEQRALVLAFKSCAESIPPITVPAAKQGRRTAFNVLSHRPEFPQTLLDGRSGRQRFWDQVEALVQYHALEEVEIRTKGYHATLNYRLTSTAMLICHID